MAKRKNKKKNKSDNGNARLSPANYIKSRARRLPIAECYITTEWKTSGMANILVARKHVNENRTFAVYLVDLRCLGIKDAAYFFNMPDYEFEEEYLESFQSNNCTPCDYPLIHNIIYGAVEYASDYGFSPYKDWNVAQYILEEDDERIPLIDIDFGDEEGKPLYISGPYDNASKKDEIIKTLERTAGQGNFHYILGMEDETDEFEEEEDDFDEPFYDEVEMDSAFAPGELEEIMAGDKMPDLRQMLLLMAVQYRIAYPEEDVIDVELLNEDIKITPDADRGNDTGSDRQMIKLLNLLLEIQEDEDADEDKSLDKLKKFRKKYGDNPLLITSIFSCLIERGDNDFGDIVTVMNEKYPDFLYFRFIHAYTLIESGRLREGWAALGQELSLDKAFPDRNHQFTVQEVISFHAAMCLYFTAQGELAKAINYGNKASELNEDEPMAMVIDSVHALCEAMYNRIPDEPEG